MIKTTAQANYNQQLRQTVTHGKYVPKSVYKALARAGRLIQMGYGHHCCGKRPDAIVQKINGIK